MFRRISLTVFLLSYCLSNFVSAADASSVRTLARGQVQGVIVDGSGAPDIAVYKNIPYAAAPIDSLRWRPPQAASPWEGIKSTDKYGPACSQGAEMRDILGSIIDGQGMSWFRAKVTKFLIGFAPEPNTSEDCLSINVWTPKGSDSEDKLPVMVWIHGGGHQGGSAGDGLYEGDKLASKGVVFVSFNYRLGALGFMAHPALSEEAKQLNGIASSGNYGLLDQIAALQWVKDNIAVFGGDSDKVTIFGESAGGHSVGQLMSSPLADGLFHRAIAQSGLGSHNYLHLSKDLPWQKSAHQGGLEFAEAAGISEEDALVELRALSAKQLLDVGSANVELMNYFHPNVDGWALKKPVASVFKAGEQADVPLLIGSNSDEGSLFSIFEMAPFFWSQELPRSVDELSALLRTEFGAKDAQALIAHYGIKEGVDVGLARLSIWGDAYFGLQALYGAEHMTTVSSPAYLYFFKRTPPSSKQTLGATHSSEIQFVFGEPMPLFPTNDYDQKLADTMSSYWVNFAKAGLPIAQSQPAWPRYLASTSRQIVFEDGAKVAGVERSWLYDIYAKRHEQIHAEVEAILQAD